MYRDSENEGGNYHLGFRVLGRVDVDVYGFAGFGVQGVSASGFNGFWVPGNGDVVPNPCKLDSQSDAATNL